MQERKTVRIICLNPYMQLLLIKIRPIHINLPFCWITPGGGVDEGESDLKAARRELYEETGIQSACFHASPLHYIERPVTISGNTRLFKENFYVSHIAHHVDHQEISRAHLQPDEQELFLEYRWWSLEDIRHSKDPIFPANLGDMLKTAQDLIADTQ